MPPKPITNATLPSTVDPFSVAPEPSREMCDDLVDASPIGDESESRGLRDSSSGIGEHRVKRIQVSDINYEDETYRFRASLRFGALKKSIETHGQQLPIVVRRGPGKRKYQIISGFRRATAIRELGWPAVVAITRNELTDEEAFRAAVLENTARKTYSDIDRANVIRRYEEGGHRSDEVATLMGLSKRQKNNLRSLLDLPREVQDAIDNPATHFKTTHALTLKKLTRRYSDLDYPRWITLCNEEALSISQLTRRVNAAYRPNEDRQFETLFNAHGTRWETGEVRFAPVKVKLDELSDAEKTRLRRELIRLLESL